MRFDPIKFIQNNADSLHILLDLIPLPMYIKDVNGKYMTCNKAFEETSGLLLKDIVGKEAYEVWSKKQADSFDAKDKELYAKPDTQDFETDVITPSGTKHVIQFHKKIFYDVNHNPAGYLCVLFDITEKKALEKLLTAQALTDELTGLTNRREGLTRLAEVLSESARKNRVFCLALLDIDNFKKINDTYGHSAGDQVIVKIAETLKSTLRDYDICARFGGEEFLMCLPDTPIDLGLKVFERVRRACESAEMVVNEDLQVKVTVSIGVAEYPTQGTAVQALLESSDAALYRVKNSGRNQVIYYGS